MQRTSRKQIIRNVASGPLNVAAGALAFLAVTPYLRAQLGNDVVGIWLLLGTFAAYLSLVYSCIGQGVTKYVAEYRAAGDRQRLQTAIGSGFWLCVLFSLAALALALGMLPLFDLLPAVREAPDPSTARSALAVLLGGMVLMGPAQGVYAVLAGYQRYDFVNALTAVKTVVRAAVMLLAVYLGAGLLALAWTSALVDAAAGVAAVLFLRYRLRVGFGWRRANRAVMRQLLAFGRFNLLNAAGNVLFHQTDNAVIAALVSARAITFYGLGFGLMDRLTHMASSAAAAFMPVASEYAADAAEKGPSMLAALFIRTSRLAIMMTFPPILVLIAYGQDFFQLWQGPTYEYARVSYAVFVILAVPRLASLSQIVGAQILIGMARHRFPSYLALAAAILNVGLSIALAPRYGVVGVAMGTAIAAIVRRVVMQYYYQYALQLPLRRYYVGVWSRLGPWLALVSGFLLLQTRLYKPGTFGGMLTLMTVTTLACWTVLYFALNAEEKTLVRSGLARAAAIVTRSQHLQDHEE